MSDNKKYYYLKLKDNFFQEESIIYLESMERGMIYVNILLKLYLMSLKSNGMLVFNDKMPYTDDMLAVFTRHQIDTVKETIEIFKELGLIVELENRVLYITDIELFVGKSSTEAERKRKARMKQENEQKE